MALLTGTPLDDAVAQFMIQLLVMLITPKLLNVVLKHIQQPLVVSEILSGVILGPSVMGLIPGFTSTVFPSSSLSSLNIVAQLGLVLFLFMVGLNLDPSKIKQYWRKSAVACAFGLVFPFVAAVPIGFLLNNSDYTLQNLGLLIGFIGLAFYISALSVLARILAERRLLDSGLGTMSLTSAAIDTFIAWIILAVILAFATTESNGRALAYLDPLWTMLLAAGHMVVLWFVVRRMLKYLSDKVKKSGTLTPLHFTLFLLIVFAVSWFTDQIGVSAMFGAFEVGVLIPRKGPAARLIKDKLEDLVVGIMLPVFFTYSGLRTDLSLINTGEAVGYTILIIIVAMASKIFPVMVAAKIFKLDWFESLAFGVLMSCKGLVALVMFNIAADKKIITPKLFTMLVVYCIVATFVVTPVTTLILDQKKAKEEREIVLNDLETHNILALPQAPKFSPPVISFAHSISQYMGLKKKKIFVVRFFELSDRISDMMSVKPKYDLILGPAIQRSHFFKIPLILKSIVTGNEVVEFDKFVFAHNIHTTIIGYDGTDITKHLISGALRARLCDVAVQCGQDLGHISKILVIYGNTENDEAAFQFVANILAAEKAEVTILNVTNDTENLNLTKFEEKFNLNNKTIIYGTGADWVDSVLNTVDLSSFSVIIAGFIPHAPNHVRPAEFFTVLDRVIESTHTPFVLVHTKSQNIFEESPSLLRSTFNLMTSLDRSRKNSQTDEEQELEHVQTVSQRPNRTAENDDV